jgi:hypothetical protein
MPVLLATILERTTGCWSTSLIAITADEALCRAAGFAVTNGRNTAIFIGTELLARSRPNLAGQTRPEPTPNRTPKV